MLDKRFGSYEITAAIGRGANAVVYRATDTARSRDVAIKILPQEYLNDLGFRARFEREVQTIAGLKHPAIVPLIDYGQYEGQLYYVMEYMPNRSLAERLKSGALPLDVTTKMVGRVSGALDYAHANGVVHRDLKPSNILFDDQDNAFLADFGIALQAAITDQGSVVLSGTPAYMSPEQARRDKSIDGRSDLYALGIVLFESLTGRPPFEGDTSMAILLKQIHDVPPSPRALDAGLSPALDPVLRTALAKDPAERYQTGAELAQAFYRACDLSLAAEGPAEPVSASPGELHEHRHAVVAVDSLPASPDAAQVSPEDNERPNDSAAVVGDPGASLPDKTMRWLSERPAVAFVLVTFLGIIAAVAVVGLIRAPQLLSSEPATATAPDQAGAVNVSIEASKESNAMLVYTTVAMTLVNISEDELNLDNVAFQRLSGDESVAATFYTSSWIQQADQPSLLLPPGACLQLLRPGQAPSDLRPGPIMLPTCDSLQGWLVVDDPGWAFWPSTSGETAIQVLLNDRLVYTCPGDSKPCSFYLPQP